MAVDARIREQHDLALQDFHDVLSAASAADATRPTPCAGWDVATLLAHACGQNTGLAADIAADVPAGLDDPGDRTDAYRAPSERGWTALVRQWDRSVAELVNARDAAAAGRPVHLSELHRTLPVEAVLRVHLLDTEVHTWDLATSVGREHRPAQDLLEVAAAVARAVPAGPGRLGAGASFAPPVEGDSPDAWVRVLRHLGRDPRRD